MLNSGEAELKEKSAHQSRTRDSMKRTFSADLDGLNRHISETACGSSIEINYEERNKKLPGVPFLFEWAFGGRRGGKVINLSYGGRQLIAFSNAHLVVLYDYKDHKQSILHGHNNSVTALSTDSEGLWLVSADSGDGKEACCVVVWEVANASKVRVLPDQRLGLGYRLAAISSDGLVVGAVTEGARAEVQLWFWKEVASVRPDNSLELPRALGRANAITFNPDSAHQLAVTCTQSVAFLTWDGEDGQLQQQTTELLSSCSRTGALLESVFLRGTPNALTVTSRGYIIVWTEPPIYSAIAKLSRRVFCIDREGLSTIAEVDKVVAIGTTRGHVRFYDHDMNILHWYKQGDSDAIVSISFALDITADADGDSSWAGGRASLITTKDRAHGDLSRLISGPAPAPAPGSTRPAGFHTRDFIVSTSNGRLAVMSFQSQRCVLLQDSQAVITAIQAHTEKSQLLIGRANGSISLLHCDKKEVLVSYTFERRKHVEPSAISSIKFSPNGLALACGLEDGSLYFLHPELLYPIAAPQHKTGAAIQNLCFSADSMFLAHSDKANFVSAYRSSDAVKGRWVYLGKKHLHGLPIRSLLFGQQFHQAPLFSLGEDLVLAEYDVAHSLNNTLLVKRLDRVDQSGRPRFMTWCPSPTNDDNPLFLITDCEFKYKLVDPETRQVCGTFQGPALLFPVRIIQIIEGPNAKAPACAVFSSTRRLGLQILPPDGNPFKSMAIKAHPDKVMNFAISACRQYVYTHGPQDPTIIMWRINHEAIDAMLSEQATDLSPWLRSVQGGSEGWLFKEMLEAFCYAQLLHQGTHSDLPREIRNALPLCELPDLMRALGYFPSLHEICSMVREVKRRTDTTIRFGDFVKLFVNYKPTDGISLATLRDAFSVYGYPMGQDEVAMTKEKFMSLLLDKGEAMSPTEAHDVLRALMGRQTASDSDDEEASFSHLLIDEATRREKMFYFVPETITFSYLMDTLLGVAVEQKAPAKQRSPVRLGQRRKRIVR